MMSIVKDSMIRMHKLVAFCGLLGVIALMISFSINPAPPAHATIPQIISWGEAHKNLILTGAWLQAVGSFLEIIFIVGIVKMKNMAARFVGLLTIIAAVSILVISLVEISFYLSAVQAGISGDETGLSVSLQLIQAIQHAYVVVPAPALLIGLGLCILWAKTASVVFAYCALLLGTALGILGFIGVFYPLQGIIDTILGIQELWFGVLSLTFLLKTNGIQHNKG